MTTPAEPLMGSPNATPAKRKQSVNEEEEGRVVKHRSSKACRSCRARKVRCDVSAKGSRCTNCELDQQDCVVLPSRRGQSNRLRHGSATSATHDHPFGVTVAHGGADAGGSARSGQTQAAIPAPQGAGSVPVVVTFDDDADNTENERQPHPAADSPENGPSDAYGTLLTPETTRTSAPLQQHSPDGKTLLPAFIAPIPARILPEDVAFLARKGAFVIPEADLCIEILRTYIFSVHPFMPMLSIRPFVDALMAGEGQMSLLLFQAVMFAGLHSLGPDVIRRLGFESPKQAREVFFNRVRLLYDFNVETDNAVVLQSLILMSSWYSKHTPWNERRHTWHWTGLAYDLARSMGLHREPPRESFSKEARCFRRRLWWSLYIRDRLIALGTRRPMRIRDDEYDVSMLTLDDFEINALEEHGQAMTLLPPKDERLSIALMCVQLCELGKVVGHVVSSQYTTLGGPSGASHTMMIMPKRDGDHVKQMEHCERELETWMQGLARNVRRADSSPATRDAQSCSEVQWAQLNMTYLTVVNVLHRAQALQSQTGGHLGASSPSKSKVKNAARSITRLGQDMLQHDHIRYLGLIGVTALLAACLTHILDVGSADEDVRDASTFRLQQSLQGLQALREIYASADSAFSFLASVTRKAGLNLPIESNALATMFAASEGGQAAVKTQEWREQRPNDLSSARQPPPNATAASDKTIESYHSRLPEAGNDAGARSHPVGASHDMLSHDRGQAPAARGLREDYGPAFPPNMAAVAGQGFGTGHQLQSTSTAGFSMMASDGNLLDWNNDVDAAAGFGSMPFNYDFFSDAFGFLDGDVHGM